MRYVFLLKSQTFLILLLASGVDKKLIYQEYEDKRTEEQLDDITDWLDQASSSGSNSRYHRFPVGILQSRLPPIS
jgi:hypothetical protein